MTAMNKEIKQILARVDAAVKDLESVEDSQIDIFEDLGVLTWLKFFLQRARKTERRKRKTRLTQLFLSFQRL